MTTFLITEDGDGNVTVDKVAELLNKVDPTNDSVITDCGNIVHQPADVTGATIESV